MEKFEKEDSQTQTQKSEWNEQMNFSYLFFLATHRCRNAQIFNDPMLWKSALDSKMSVVIGILDPKEKEEIIAKKTETDKKLREYMMLKRKVKNPYDIELEFKNLLFDTEAILDEMANKHMPFLKIEEELDWDQF